MPKTIEAWLEYIQGLHAREIDLSLERVNAVYKKLRPQGVNFQVITVAGTNGKGSTCELLTSIYAAAGYSTGKYTSPHILNFNERFEIDRHNVADAKLLDALRRVENAREQIPLTFFEFGTLVSIELFADHAIDIAIMEVGLGGRLDAVNILAADVAIVSSISIDHVDWLGDSIEKIALEKIAITRSGHPCVLGMRDVPQVIVDYCRGSEVPFSQLGVDFDYEYHQDDWQWRSQSHRISAIDKPFKQFGVQLDNAATAIKAVQYLQHELPTDDDQIRQGIANASLSARCHVESYEPLIVVDVAHNQASISELLRFIKTLEAKGKIYALCGMLKDKQIAESLTPLIEFVDEWNLVSIHSSRGSEAESLRAILDGLSSGLLSYCFGDAQSAYKHVLKKIKSDDVLIVFGSFFIVSDIMPLLKIRQA